MVEARCRRARRGRPFTGRESRLGLEPITLMVLGRFVGWLDLKQPPERGEWYQNPSTDPDRRQIAPSSSRIRSCPANSDEARSFADGEGRSVVSGGAAGVSWFL